TTTTTTTASPPPDRAPLEDPLERDVPATSGATSTRPPPRATRARGGLTLFGSAGFGGLPTRDLGGGLGLAVFGRPYRVELRGLLLARNHHQHPTQPQVVGTVSLWTGALRAGPSWRAGPLELGLLGMLELGVMSAEAQPLENSALQRDLWAALGVVVDLRWPVHELVALAATIEGAGVLRSPRFVVGGLGTFYEARPTGVRATLGIELRLPARRP
ncbi:MAG: hypothetical protein KC468_32160, partial [Myxococcales bacterium]|nr:hypothetical protein [Myxococcales bacterium]